MSGSLTLITGGARSGKSRCGLDTAAAGPGPVLVIATGVATDGEIAARIAQHQAARPPSWRVLEVRYDLAATIEQTWRGERCLLIEDLPTLVANLLVERSAGQSDVQAELEAILSFAHDRSLDLIVVSGEVGLGIVPEGRLSREFRDLLGLANQYLALVAERVVLMVAGLPLQLKG
jgi:adenosylcobinamide kinase/adenosylcobinamide-phosphate guanylyltransferase